MGEFSLWYILQDLGVISLLLLIGVFLRAKIKMIQSLFIPASILAGALGLALGPNGLNIVPFSPLIGDYPSILIAVIFGAIPIGAAKIQWKETFGKVRNMWTYSFLMELLIWGGGALFTIVILNAIWNLSEGFGLILGAGFLGGHGWASAIGVSLGDLGWDESEALTLGFTSATVGILVSIIGGLFLIKLSTKKRETSFIKDFNELPEQLRTGLIKKQNRKAFGENTVSSMSIDPLFFHLAILLVVIVVSYYVQQYLNELLPQIGIPLLSVAYVIGLIMQAGFRKTKVDDYIDKSVVDRLSGTATDMLVAFGIASINLSIVMSYVLPLVLLFVFGTLCAFFIFKFIAPRFFKENTFENAIFGWGWSTGTVAMSIALLRIVDPDNRATTLQDYSMSYIALVPFEVAILTFGPIMMMNGMGVLFTSVLLLTAIVLYLVARHSGWLVPRAKV